MKQKIKQTLMAIVGLLLSTSAFAHNFEVDGIYYNYLDETAKTVKVTYCYSNEYSGSVTIPSSVTYSGTTYSVTSIGDYAFRNCTGLTSITIPNSVTEIGDYAFRNCTGLTSITIPNSVTEIGGNAFNGCKGLTSVTIPNSVTSIGDGAFYGCTGLTSVTIPNSVTSISYQAFYGCKGLTSVTIPNSVTSIGDGAFYGCTGLTSVTIPNSVTSIGSWAFYDCSGLTSITIPNSVTEIGGNAFNGCKGLTSVTIPNSVTSISYQAFYGCKGLTSVTIPNSVTSIGYGAFQDCTSLTSVTIPNSVTSISSWAFQDCTSLTSITIPNSVTSIGDDAFRNCTGLTSITIPNSVTEIGGNAFYVCKGLTEVNYNAENCTSMGSSSEPVFYDCTNLKTINIGNSVKTIPSYAFYGCEGLISVTIGSGISSIPNNAFYVKPKKTIWLTNTPPSKCENVAGRVNYVANNQYSSLSNIVVYPYLSSMFEVDGVKYVPISPSERTCDAIDCAYNPSATNINIGNTVSFKGVAMTVNEIKPYTCYDNDNIKGCTINYTGNIGEYAFYSCDSLESLNLTVNKIERNAFEGCSAVRTITLGNKLEAIGDYAFRYCRNLSDVIIKDRDSVLTLGSNGSNPMFSDCPLDSVYIGGDISYNTRSSYGYSPFYNNKTLRAVTITDKETEISDNEFYGCSNLKCVSIGDGVESIGKWAFSGCSSLDYFAFGSSMKTIGEEAFSDCTAVTKIYSRATTPPVCGTQALDDINKWTCELFIPISTLSSYQAADQWKEFFYISEDTGVEDVEADNNAIEVVRYDIHGRLLSEPAKGINIIKMSDGTTRKEIVK